MQAGLPRQDRFLRVVGVDVAGTSAIAQLRDGVVNLHGLLELGVRRRSILVHVAAGATRPKRGEFPGDDLGVR